MRVLLLLPLLAVLVACGASDDDAEPTGGETPPAAGTNPPPTETPAGGGPETDPTATSEGGAPAGDIAWQASFGADLYVLPAADGEMVVASTGPRPGFDDGPREVVAFAFEGGEELWRVDTVVVPYLPAIDGDTVYVGAGDGTVYALDRETGEERWTASLPGLPFLVSPQGDTVYVSDLDPETYSLDGLPDEDKPAGTVAALDAATGEERWRVETGCYQAYLVPGDGIVYLAGSRGCMDGSQGYLAGLDPEDGEELWRTIDFSLTSPPLIREEAVYVASSRGITRAIDPLTGKGIWQTEPVNGGTHQFPVEANGVVYANSNTHTFEALDAATGDLLWSAEYPDCSGTAAVVGDRVYASACGRLAALSTADGSLAETIEVEMVDSPLLFIDGRLVAGAEDGTLTVYR